MGEEMNCCVYCVVLFEDDFDGINFINPVLAVNLENILEEVALNYGSFKTLVIMILGHNRRLAEALLESFFTAMYEMLAMIAQNRDLSLDLLHCSCELRVYPEDKNQRLDLINSVLLRAFPEEQLGHYLLAVYDGEPDETGYDA